MRAVAEWMSVSPDLQGLCGLTSAGQSLVNIANTDRFAIYKLGPILTVSVRTLYTLSHTPHTPRIIARTFL